MEKQIEKVKELLEKHAENVSVNHWIRAIHEDKFQMVAEEIVKLFPISDVSGSLRQFTKSDLEDAFDAGTEYQYNYDDRKRYCDDDAPNFDEWFNAKYTKQ